MSIFLSRIGRRRSGPDRARVVPRAEGGVVRGRPGRAPNPQGPADPARTRLAQRRSDQLLHQPRRRAIHREQGSPEGEINPTCGHDASRALQAYAFSSFFYPRLAESGHAAVARWTRKVDIFAYDLLLVPVHLGAHWCLAVCFTIWIVDVEYPLSHFCHCCDQGKWWRVEVL